jgi:hypothetical protein
VTTDFTDFTDEGRDHFNTEADEGGDVVKVLKGHGFDSISIVREEFLV